MKPHARQEAIVRTLRRTGITNIDTLATALHASKRTILRDIGVLRDQGFVIHSESGRGGGLQLEPQSAQTSAPLSVIEIFALIISITTLRAAQSFPFTELADIGLAKIEKRLPADKIKDLQHLLACLYIGKLSPAQDVSRIGTIDPNLLSKFETSFLKKFSLRFEYTDVRSVKTIREVEPQAMLILPPLWYLVAWDLKRDDFRHFRMDRIRKPEIIEGAFFRRRHVPFEKDVCPYSKNRS